MRAAHATDRLLTIAVGLAVGAAFADSSIVSLALPDLYGAFHTSIVGVSWVITSYNVVVAALALALVPLVPRLSVARTARIGLALFFCGSVGCAAAWSLAALIAFRCLQGVGGALVLAAALPLLGGLAHSRARGAVLWGTAGTIGAAVGPALGGALTQLFDWRAIFVVQAPVALVALAATFDRRVTAIAPEPRTARGHGALTADVAIALVFGALVGALFLSVLMVITVWGLEPIVGALVVSALPLATVAVRPLARSLPPRVAAVGGAVLLAAGLVAVGLLPAVSNALVAICLAFCGAGLGLTVPVLGARAVDPEHGLLRSGTITVGARHAGLVLALAAIAPLLTGSLEQGGDRALLVGTRVILDGEIGLTKKVPIALDLKDALDAAPQGEIPDLAEPFDRRGARSSESLRRVRNELVGTLRGTITRSFRPGFLLSAALALASVLPVLWLTRRRRAA